MQVAPMSNIPDKNVSGYLCKSYNARCHLLVNGGPHLHIYASYRTATPHTFDFRTKPSHR
jgi:hypothetical protein